MCKAGESKPPLRLSFRGRIEDLGADEIERWLSTESKLVDVLAGLMDRPPPKKAKWWSQFKALGRLRDATIHLKARYVYPYTEQGFPKESFFHELLNERSLITFPRTSIAAIGHYFDPDAVPMWLAAAKVIAHRD